MTSAPTPTDTDYDVTLFHTSGRLAPEEITAEYLDFEVPVPTSLPAIKVELAFTKVVDEFQLYAALFDATGVFRGHVQCPGGPGHRELRFTVAQRGSSWGCIDGPLTPGTWTVRIDLDRFVVAGDYALTVRATSELPPARPRPNMPEQNELGVQNELRVQNGTSLVGWARGELHTHSLHSDGAATPAEIVDAAVDAGLSFLAISDHFTSSHWTDVDRLASLSGAPSLLHSIEVTSHYGHSNVHGLTSVPNTYIDDAGSLSQEGTVASGFRQLAADVHAQGGLVSVNHPYSGRQAWRRSDAPWEVVDLIEVLNASQGANNDAAIGLWDGLLAAGHRIIAVAGTDSHDPGTEDGRLGVLTTLLRQDPGATALTEHAVIDALRSGSVCVSRGAAIDLTAQSGDGDARMGGELTLDGALTLTASVDSPSDGVLFLFRNGLMWGVHPLHAGRSEVAVIDDTGTRGTYRAEFHRGDDSEQFWASCNRSHASLLALSNPIWIC